MQFPNSKSEIQQAIDAARGKAYESENVATVMTLLARDINRWAKAKGFWCFDVGSSHDLVKTTKIMLVVTELAELVEGLRKNSNDETFGFTNEEEEVADAIIRLLDYAGQYGLRIGECVNAKMAVNEGRPYRHGKGF